MVFANSFDLAEKCGRYAFRSKIGLIYEIMITNNNLLTKMSNKVKKMGRQPNFSHKFWGIFNKLVSRIVKSKTSK